MLIQNPFPPRRGKKGVDLPPERSFGVGGLLSLFFMLSFCSADSEIIELTDNQYHYAFQYPRSWKLEKTPDHEDENRFLLKSPSGSYLNVIVGKFEEKVDITLKGEHVDQIISWMMDWTIERVYNKRYREIIAIGKIWGGWDNNRQGPLYWIN